MSEKEAAKRGKLETAARARLRDALRRLKEAQLKERMAEIRGRMAEKPVEVALIALAVGILIGMAIARKKERAPD